MPADNLDQTRFHQHSYGGLPVPYFFHTAFFFTRQTVNTYDPVSRAHRFRYFQRIDRGHFGNSGHAFKIQQIQIQCYPLRPAIICDTCLLVLEIVSVPDRFRRLAFRISIGIDATRLMPPPQRSYAACDDGIRFVPRSQAWIFTPPRPSPLSHSPAL